MLQEATGDDSGTSELICWKFDQEACKIAVARMIIIDELPFRIVEREGFRSLMKVVQPRFKVPSRSTITRTCIDIFMSEKLKLKEFIKKHANRVCLTTDSWTSLQNINYMSLTVHFIDDNWTLYKRILNFSPITSHKGEAIAKVLEKCLIEWGIEKVFCITLDNASSNDVAVNNLRRTLNKWKGSVLDGEFLHMRCAAHILNLIVKDGLDDVTYSVARIRSAIRFVRSFPARWLKFKTCVEHEKITSKGLVCLDCDTRWNSIFLMLDASLKFQKAFE